MQKLSLGTKIIVHSLLICGAIISIMPFMWMVTTSLKPYGALYQPPLLIPMHFEWSNYVEALSAAPFGRFFMNSFIMTIGITVLQTIFLQWRAMPLQDYAFQEETPISHCHRYHDDSVSSDSSSKFLDGEFVWLAKYLSSPDSP